MRAASRLSLLFLFGIAVIVRGADNGAPASVKPPDRIPLFIELTEHSAAHQYSQVIAAQTPAATRPSRRVLDQADTASRTQLRVVLNQQERFARTLRASGLPFSEIYRVQRVLNGFAVMADASALQKIRQMPDVARVLPMSDKFPTSAPASNAVPFTNVPAVWQLPVGPGHADGTGIRIGIIDTGIDYIHADFGGSGALADYQANDTTAASTAFYPSAKVVGGVDLAGDAYTGGNTPVPDLNPMDCNGHGSHVAGIAAGFGVTTGGTTFSGPYDGTTPFSSLRIHPGVAPKALLYGIRVFGCRGSTNLATQGVEWAVDPNNDGNLSDHLDVVNMSLGSAFGALDDDPDTLAVNAAAAAGVAMAVSAGNDGNVYFIAGGPGTADRAITIAASDDNGSTAGGFHIDLPPALAGYYLDTVPLTYGGTPP